MEAYQKCINPECGTIYDIREVLSACRSCDNLLDVEYRWGGDMFRLFKDLLQTRVRTNHIYDESGVWRFRELLQFMGRMDTYDEMSSKLVTLDGAEGNTKPFHLQKVAEYVGINPKGFYLQFEGSNPTGSFKDNGMASAFTHAKMVGAKKVACASTGNTASSMAAYAANESAYQDPNQRMEAILFMGSGKIAKGKLAQSLDSGARVIQIEGDFDDAMARVQEVSKCKKIYLMNSLNPFRLEGQKTIMYRVLEGLNWQVPDWIVCPGGNLGNASAFGKAFLELKELNLINRVPRIAIINAEGARTLDVLVNQKGLIWNNGYVDNLIIADYYNFMDRENIKARTIASAIEINRPVNLKKALRTLAISDGVVTTVSDEEMLDAKAIIGINGFGCEPASGATVAGIKRLVELGIINQSELVVGILTGNQLKDPDATLFYHSNPSNRFANIPIMVPNNLEEILRVL